MPMARTATYCGSQPGAAWNRPKSAGIADNLARPDSSLLRRGACLERVIARLIGPAVDLRAIGWCDRPRAIYCSATGRRAISGGATGRAMQLPRLREPFWPNRATLTTH